MKLSTLLKAIFIAALALSFSAFAAKPVVTGDLTLTPTDNPVYGDQVIFLVALDGKLAREHRIIVTVQCKQTLPDGWIVVYQSGSDTDFTFLLADQDFPYLEWDGQTADCHAELLYRETVGQKTITWRLDTVDFYVTGQAAAQ